MQTAVFGNLALVLRCEWDEEETYRANDVVRHNAATWGAKRKTIAGEKPGIDSAAWVLIMSDVGMPYAASDDEGKVLTVGEGGGPEWRAASGLPLLIPIAVPFSTVMLGFLSCCADNGVLTADAFPEAYEQLVLLQSQGETNIVAMAAYAAEMTANGGICGRFALDEETQTFRIPCAPGAYWRGVKAGLNVGQYQIDQMRPITGGGFDDTGFSENVYGAIYFGGNTKKRAGNTNTAEGRRLNTALLGPHFDGIDTHPQSIVCDWQMMVRGA
jgi:hypothetical protein